MGRALMARAMIGRSVVTGGNVVARRAFAGSAALVGLSLLAGCSTASRQAELCPAANIINGLDRHVESDGTLVTIGNIQGRCSVDGTTLYLDYAVDLAAEGAATAMAGDLPVTYFVALVDEAGNPVDKALIETRVPLMPGARNVVRESIDQEISNVAPGTASGWQVLIGLQLSKDEALRQRKL